MKEAAVILIFHDINSIFTRPPRMLQRLTRKAVIDNQ